MLKRGVSKLTKKGQVTVFVVIALVIIAAVVAVFLIRRQLAPGIPSTGIKPSQISLQFEAGIKECIRSTASESVKELMEVAGDAELEFHSVQYMDKRYTYLCYTQLYNTYCVNQNPFLKETFEREIAGDVEEAGGDCVGEILKEAEDNGYEVDRGIGTIKANANIKSNRIEVSYSQDITVTKGTNRFRFNRFDVPLSSNLDLFLSIANDIVNDEATLADYDQFSIMILFSDIDIDSQEYGESTLYTLKKGIEEFRFAVRSYVSPESFI